MHAMNKMQLLKINKKLAINKIENMMKDRKNQLCVRGYVDRPFHLPIIR